MPFPIPTPLAMKIAGVSNLVFNEAVSRRYYLPLVPGHQGKSRLFDEVEMFGLYVMGDLLRLGLELEIAASRAMLARDIIKDDISVQDVWISRDHDGKRESVWPDGVPTGHAPTLSIVIHVNHVWADIADAADREKP